MLIELFSLGYYYSVIHDIIRLYLPHCFNRNQQMFYPLNNKQIILWSIKIVIRFQFCKSNLPHSLSHSVLWLPSKGPHLSQSILLSVGEDFSIGCPNVLRCFTVFFNHPEPESIRFHPQTAQCGLVRSQTAHNTQGNFEIFECPRKVILGLNFARPVSLPV